MPPSWESSPRRISAQPPGPHPFAAAGPVVFQLGTVAVALYQATPKRGTQPGDVGIGLAVGEAVTQVCPGLKNTAERCSSVPRDCPRTVASWQCSCCLTDTSSRCSPSSCACTALGPTLPPGSTTVAAAQDQQKSKEPRGGTPRGAFWGVYWETRDGGGVQGWVDTGPD